jgi:hypothetical protein
MKNNILKPVLIGLLSILCLGHAMAQCDFVDPKTGNRYIGQCKSKIVDGKVIRYPDGEGKQINRDESYFIGKFLNGQRVSGTYYWKEGHRIEKAVYENDNLKSGVYYFPNGAKYEGTFKNDELDGEGVYSYEKTSEKIRYKGAFSKSKFNGEGVLYYKNGSEDRGTWENGVFLGANIGIYQRKPVLKKGDTIITQYDNKRYLLTQQPFAEHDGYHALLNEAVKKGTFIIQRTINDKDYTKKIPIGYITHSGEVSFSPSYDNPVNKLTNVKNCEFHTKKEKIDREKIGEYNDLPVYRENQVIIVTIPTQNGTGEDKYLLVYQPYQKSNDNKLTRYFLIYEGENVRFSEKKDKNPVSHNKNALIGWINYDYQSTYRFIQYLDRVPGLNYFGSIYIGDNNPLNANGTPNYDLPAQDEIDAAAKEHDICYDNNGLHGTNGVFNLQGLGLHCDNDLAAACFKELNLDDYAAFKASAFFTSTNQKFVAGLIDKLMNSHYTLGILSREVFTERTKRDRAILVMTFFAVISTGKATAIMATTVSDKIPAIIDFTAGAFKTGIGFASTATTGFFAVEGFAALAVPILSVAAINLGRDAATCYYYMVSGKDDYPSYCTSTIGMLKHAWLSNEALVEVGKNLLGAGMIKAVGTKQIINVGQKAFKADELGLQTLNTITSLFPINSEKKTENK